MVAKGSMAKLVNATFLLVLFGSQQQLNGKEEDMCMT